MKNIVKIDMELMDLNFEYDGDLYRINGKRIASKPLTCESLKILDKDGEVVSYLKTERIIYAMAHRELDGEFDELIKNDNGDMVAVPHNIKSIFTKKHNQSKRVFFIGGYDDKSRDKNYIVRIVNIDSERIEKTFKYEQDAIRYARELFKELWKDELTKYNLWHTYLNMMA